MNHTLLNWLLPIFLLAPGIVRAEVGAPDALVKTVTEEVLAIIRQDKAIQAGDRQPAIALIERKVAPHFDFYRMTSLAIGRSWQQIDSTQRTALTGEFRTLLIRTYANSLTAYRDQTVSFKPANMLDDDNEIIVRSQINKPGTRPIPIDYSLVRSEAGWKVFDVAIANVSLVTNYRSSFASEVEKGGIAGLLKTLQDKNHLYEKAQ